MNGLKRHIIAIAFIFVICLIPCSTRTLCISQDSSYQIPSDSMRFVDYALTKGIAYKNMVNELKDEVLYYEVMLGGTERERDSLVRMVNALPREVEVIDWKVTGLVSLAAVIIVNIITIFFLIQANKK